MDRRGVELTFNAIIISILALLVLAVMTMFFTGMMDTIITRFQGFPVLEFDPTPERPIEFLPLTVAAGADTKMSVAFYNTEGTSISSSTLPSISCNGISSVAVTAAGADIAPGEIGRYAVIVTIPEDVEKKDYACTMTISETQDTFFMSVV